MSDTPETVEIAMSGLTLWQAAQYTADGDSYWQHTMPAIIRQFNIPYGDYWNMTVAEHAAFVTHVEQLGAAADGS